MIAGFAPRFGITPTPANRRRPHVVAVVAFDGVVLGDLSAACEVFGLATTRDGRRAYEVRVCSDAVNVESMHVSLRVPWRLSSVARADTVIVPSYVVRRGAARAWHRFVRARSCWRPLVCSMVSAQRRTGWLLPISPVVILRSISTRMCSTWTTAAC
jgi:transcriptional regulator GlxA family with amidase domain